jgi:hypothetical protein
MREFVQTLTARLGINGLGRALGLNGSSVLAWVRGESLPSADLVGPLATLAGVEPEAVLHLLIRAQTERAARRRARPPSGSAGPAVVPSRRPRARATRRKLAGWLLAVASGAALGQPLGAGSPRLITAPGEWAPTRGILSRWARRQAA